MLTLTPAETTWLQAYQAYLKTEFPGCVEEISIFGSKARGDARADSDLDVLVVIREGDWRFKEALTRPGMIWRLAQRWCLPSMSIRSPNGSTSANRHRHFGRWLSGIG
jgi:predicted nucleotidyltransferase